MRQPKSIGLGTIPQENKKIDIESVKNVFKGTMAAERTSKIVEEAKKAHSSKGNAAAMRNIKQAFKRGEKASHGSYGITAMSEKKDLKLGDKRVAFDMIYRVLLSPVTHLSPANGGRPYCREKFAKVARVAQEKVTFILRYLLAIYDLIVFEVPKPFHSLKCSPLPTQV